MTYAKSPVSLDTVSAHAAVNPSASFVSKAARPPASPSSRCVDAARRSSMQAKRDVKSLLKLSTRSCANSNDLRAYIFTFSTSLSNNASQCAMDSSNAGNRSSKRAMRGARSPLSRSTFEDVSEAIALMPSNSCSMQRILCSVNDNRSVSFATLSVTWSPCSKGASNPSTALSRFEWTSVFIPPASAPKPCLTCSRYLSSTKSHASIRLATSSWTSRATGSRKFSKASSTNSSRTSPFKFVIRLATSSWTNRTMGSRKSSKAAG
mmetsp:Transcript_42011/g.121812  ORF Transcript_42011/g.121812 Transcript_42011/m.121812 type:complete len:264 (+) Transcript_42011:347-1138(+)